VAPAVVCVSIEYRTRIAISVGFPCRCSCWPPELAVRQGSAYDAARRVMEPPMAIITFSLTEEQFATGKKTVTRRDWSDRHRRMWQNLWDSGRLEHDAWDRIPIAGGRPIGRLRLTARPYVERLRDMPESDLYAEGGMCATIDGFCQLIGKLPDDYVTVIRFEKVPSGSSLAR